MHYSNKNNLLIVTWIPYFTFICISIIFIYTYPSDKIYENIQGSIYVSPPFQIYGKYIGLDALSYSYCNLNNEKRSKNILIEPNDDTTNCFTDSINFGKMDIFICCILALCFIGVCISTCWSVWLDFRNRDYGKIALIGYAINCLIAYILLYILRFQPFVSKYFSVPNINSGTISSYSGIHQINMCHFNYTDEFKKCYCKLINNNTLPISYLNVSNGEMCKFIPNGYLFGMIIFGVGTLGMVVLYYSSHNQPEYELDTETIFFTKDDFSS